MKLKNKITLLTSLWVVCILLLVDCTVYLLFIRIATENEKESLLSKSEQIIEKIGPDALLQRKNLKELMLLLPQDTVIRIVSPQSAIVNLIKDEENMNLPPIKTVSEAESELVEGNGSKVVIVRMPIISNNQIIGTFEMAERMEALDSSISLLITLLLASTGGAVLLSILGGTFISRTVIKPISTSIQTMQEIEESLTFKKIPSAGAAKDEMFQMTETFNRMIDRLEESFAKQQQFVSDASHELNTTLTIVEGYANMLRRWGTKDARIQKESIDNIYDESKRMRKMTEQLLELASSGKGLKLETVPMDLVDCCEQVLSLVTKLHENRDIDLSTSGHRPILIADPMKIKQLLLILLDNALKYSEDRIELSVRTEKNIVEIHVKDKGIGIPKDQTALVFERFYRVDQARQRKTGGTGLGLPIAKSIVLEHHGTIQIVSGEGDGTEVIIKLPKASTD
ncbi:sensor histidine kinase YkoH [Paenibacillus baekrokdamisoli]|uniref:Signal transduction histidine-protein kinase ArlS n=1 Tax=Paenibacillus baekrokdamisoli TaxID=1712516 RepID=A0A3G9J4I1_9BACL|nr:HAMP domain-containing histidine kinase [Paenibacillus baekrokdamisoli]MBB3069946.1 signal transduction histidine kinase [Paenibacillus baekrokdamisoli]BBH20701.1 sensor histidine kinase YkoH [Paenibacillus baekrokdamisoli]